MREGRHGGEGDAVEARWLESSVGEQSVKTIKQLKKKMMGKSTWVELRKAMALKLASKMLAPHYVTFRSYRSTGNFHHCNKLTACRNAPQIRISVDSESADAVLGSASAEDRLKIRDFISKPIHTVS